MEPIKFYIGQESGIVVEKDNFASSIFAEQYKQTFEIFNQIWSSQEILRYLTSSSVQQKDELKDIVNDSDKNKYQNRSNIIAFCGDRGEGKTSLLTSVREILRGGSAYKNADDSQILGKHKWSPNDILTLDIIDPLFFDNKHNLIDLLLGQMMVRLEDEERCRQERENYDVKRVELKNKLIQHFQRAKECLKSLNVEGSKSAYDDLENLDDLASGTKLKKELDNLFECYNEYFGVKRLVICVDDLDMNAEGGTNMAVQMRRYLCHSKHCILLVAVKVEQLEDIISSSICRSIETKVVPILKIREMSHRYVNKLLPLTSRVMMPLGTEIVEKSLQIINQEGKKSPSLTVKEWVVLLIYQQTRYVFVNGRGLSPIVPTNLRELRHLIGDLYGMEDIDSDIEENLLANQEAFKQYFYHSWTRCLKSKHITQIQEILSQEDLVAINKMVVCVLSEEINFLENISDKDILKQQFVRAITNKKNQNFNVSVGDVFLLIQLAEAILVDTELCNLIFFIKTFYSIKLYDLYNVISSNSILLNPNSNKTMATIYRLDEQFNKANVLQRFVNGSLFTYEQGTLLPGEGRLQIPRDKRIINANALKEQFSSAITDKNGKIDAKLLQLCEFFALTTTIDLRQEDIKNINDRTIAEPLYLKEHSDSNNLLWFDVFSIFYNIINIEQTYKRFNKWCGDKDFYEIAKSNPESLLRLMFDKCTKKKQIPNHIEPDMHGLLSSAIIRVANVQQSILEGCNLSKTTAKQGGNKQNISTLYHRIQELDIHLYPIFDKKDEHSMDGKDLSSGHKLGFTFLTVIQDFLKSVTDKQFDDIFSRVEEKVALAATQKRVATPDKILQLESVFGKALKDISLSFPMRGGAIINILVQEYPYVCNYMGGKQYLETLINSTWDYELEEIFNTLAPYASNAERAYKKYLKDQEKEREKEYRLRKEKEEQERKKNEADQAKQKADRDSKERMNRDKLAADLAKQKALLASKEKQKQAELDFKLKKEVEKTKQLQAQALLKNAINKRDMDLFEKRITDKVIEIFRGKIQK